MSLTGGREDRGTASEISLSGEHDTTAKSPIQLERPTSPVPSCVSMKSDQSMRLPITFRKGVSRDQQERTETEILSGQSVQSHQTDLSYIFTLLEQNIMIFVKKELERFKTMVSTDLPEGFESQREDEEGVDPEDVKQEISAKEGALKIALHVLRNMNQKELADTLEKGQLPMICQRELKSNLKNKYIPQEFTGSDESSRPGFNELLILPPHSFLAITRMDLQVD
ncbi:hypothetical protein DPEC_G00214470 [Dallia pectoralis]|uniref:Uncharacterized protein n=1 Tax=Dallia pectoralis TaxID=75939 RepID=A0ACC2G240_DALPE|nr:hypothetical protein DPEC_G00214470 [Dallia pectoralis]